MYITHSTIRESSADGKPCDGRGPQVDLGSDPVAARPLSNCQDLRIGAAPTQR